MLMTAADYRESLRRYKPRVFVNGAAVASVADEPLLAPGVAGVGVTYDFALQPEHVPIMTARQGTSGKTVNRMLHINRSSQDLLDKLEAVRLVCRTSGCAQRYLSHDALNGLYQATRLTDDRHGTDYSQRFLNYLHEVQDQDLTLGVAMTDAKGDRSKRPGLQANTDVYVHIRERRPDGIVIRGTKAIVTGAPYMHEFPRHAVPHPCACRQGFCGLLRRAGRCARRHHRRASGRPARRCRGEIFRQVRPVGRSRDVRRRVRAA
ncbi:aromatic ring hydroxylase [Bradyrhizobium elkanii]